MPFPNGFALTSIAHRGPMFCRHVRQFMLISAAQRLPNKGVFPIQDQPKDRPFSYLMCEQHALSMENVSCLGSVQENMPIDVDNHLITEDLLHLPCQDFSTSVG